MEKHFLKIISQWKFNYDLFINLAIIIIACDFSLSLFILKRGILPALTNSNPYLKTTFHIKLKFFLWAKLLESLLLAKYLISVAAPLTIFPKKLYNRCLDPKYASKKGMVSENYR